MSKNIWLVQAGRFRETPKEGEILGFSHIIDLKYMGAAEFEIEQRMEYGSTNPLYNSVRRIVRYSDNYAFVEISKVKDSLGRKLYLYCNKDDAEELIPLVIAFSKNDYAKRGAGLCRYLKASPDKIDENEDLWNFWWDIKNDFVMVFGEERRDLIQNHVEVMRQQWPDLFPQPKLSLWEKIKLCFKKS